MGEMMWHNVNGKYGNIFNRKILKYTSDETTACIYLILYILHQKKYWKIIEIFSFPIVGPFVERYWKNQINLKAHPKHRYKAATMHEPLLTSHNAMTIFSFSLFSHFPDIHLMFYMGFYISSKNSCQILPFFSNKDYGRPSNRVN